MAEEVTTAIHFTDGTSLKFQHTRQAGEDWASMMTNLKKALEADKFAAEVGGDLIVIPTANIKYVRVSPAPSSLPHGILRDAKIVK
jgi:hypothetical protein